MQMTQAQLWLRNPKKLWLRRAVFQVHLWSGIILGLYVVVVCVSGSAIVFRNDIENVLSERSRVSDSGSLLSREQMRQAVQRAYPDYTISSIKPGRFSNEATEVTIDSRMVGQTTYLRSLYRKRHRPLPGIPFSMLARAG